MIWVIRVNSWVESIKVSQGGIFMTRAGQIIILTRTSPSAPSSARGDSRRWRRRRRSARTSWKRIRWSLYSDNRILWQCYCDKSVTISHLSQLNIWTFVRTFESIPGGAATYSEGFVYFFLRVPQAVGLNCSCHDAQASKGNFNKTYYKTFGTSGRPTQ